MSNAEDLTLQRLWQEEGSCESPQEAEAIWDEFVTFAIEQDEHADLVQNDENASCTVEPRLMQESIFSLAMKEYFDLSKIESANLLRRWVTEGQDEEEKIESTPSSEMDDLLSDVVDLEKEGNDEFVGEGECELCERYIRISHHHLIPRSTWHRLEPKLLNAAQALLECDGMERAQAIAGEGLSHLLEEIQQYYCRIHDRPTESKQQKTKVGGTTQRRRIVRHLIQRTCNVCRPCHTAIHQTHDNLTLALEYNTMDKLLQDPAILKFSKWASKHVLASTVAVILYDNGLLGGKHLRLFSLDKDLAQCCSSSISFSTLQKLI